MILWIIPMVLGIFIFISSDSVEKKFKKTVQNKNSTVNIVMLGNSITAGGNWTELMARNDIVNQGISGDTIGGMLSRLQSIINLYPRLCFIMGGINDITMQISVTEIYYQYKKMVLALKLNNIIPVIQSTLYVSKNLSVAPIINSKVKALNDRLMSFSQKNNIYYLDVNVVLSTNESLMHRNTHDGVHLSSEGYKSWKQIIIAFLDKFNF